MKRHRWTWTLAALLGIGLGAYEGITRYRGAGKPHRTARLRAIDAALADARWDATPTRTAQVQDATESTELAHWNRSAAA